MKLLVLSSLINVKAFLGLTRYYHHLIEGYVNIVLPLFNERLKILLKSCMSEII
jgi:hypothetical protein